MRAWWRRPDVVVQIATPPDKTIIRRAIPAPLAAGVFSLHALDRPAGLLGPPLGEVLDLTTLRRASRGNRLAWGSFIVWRGEVLWAVMREGRLVRVDRLTTWEAGR